MEMIFIAGFILIASLYFLSQSLARGVGNMGDAFQQIGMFILKKNPPGLIDIFDDKDGSGSRTWMNFGMVWFVFAGILGFLGAWHNYDPTALDSLASIGWSYDDGSSLREATMNILGLSLLYGLVGGGLIAASRNGNGRLASEGNASMTALLLTVVLIMGALLPFIFSFANVDTGSTVISTLLLSLETLAVGLLLIPVLINVLLTVSARDEQELATSSWFLIMALTAKIFAMFYLFLGELTDATQMVWFGERVSNGWVPLALMFSVGYYTVPMVAKQPIWSKSMRTASMLLLFVTIPPFFMTSAEGSNVVMNFGAILLILGMIPIFAASINIMITANNGIDSIVKNPGALAGLFAFIMLPFFAIGGYFTSMDTFVGTGELGAMAYTVDMGMMFTVGGLLILSAVFTNYPMAVSKPLATPSTANLAVWMVLVGGVTSTVTFLIGDFTTNAITTSGIEDVVAPSGGFFLTGAAMFYLLGIGAILATLVTIRTGISSVGRSFKADATSDVTTYTLVAGTSTTIRSLIGRGVGVDTELVVNQTEEHEGGSTIIAVESLLHNDEITEFPPKAPTEAMIQLVQYLADNGQSVFDLFRSMDLDASGKVDGEEFLTALRATEIDALSAVEADGLMESMDLDGDGELNLPELDIAIAQIKRDYDIIPSASSEEE
ncbi:MAG TPA: EF-hand domain-containing protein [Poseidonia sp.]|nr:EF-hand domain-containing protein [Poseidonia sp.]